MILFLISLGKSLSIPLIYVFPCHGHIMPSFRYAQAMTLKDLHLTSRREGDLETLIRRSHTLVAHDLGLLFGMRNCQFYLCRMQGSSGVQESDTNQDKADRGY